MRDATITVTSSGVRSKLQSSCFGSFRLCCAVLLLLVATIPKISWAQTPQQARPTGAQLAPEAAVTAILAAFDKFEVVGMSAGHGEKDLDDFILSLIRSPAFSEKVNDIEVECGNSLYQSVLDRYIAGEDVPFSEARKVWRNTTQPMCGLSGFYDQLFPLVRAINQKIPKVKRLRILAGDSPIDWDQIKTSQQRGDAMRNAHRDLSIASVMKKEVLSKHRKALMLFGIFHLVHGANGSAVSFYEKDYPKVTFVISELGTFDTNLPSLASSSFVAWPIPSLARAKSTWIGALDVSQFFPPPVLIDQDCNVHHEFPKQLQKPIEDLVDAFLYLGPQDLRLKEPMPADIALDLEYRTEVQGRGLTGSLGSGTRTMQEWDRQIMQGAENPLFIIDTKVPDQAEINRAVQGCAERRTRQNSPPQ